LNQAVDSIRRISHELRPTILDDLGLIPAVEVLAEGVAARTDLRVTVEGSTSGRLPGPVETALYRIIQEALANAIRHARCTGVDIRFGRENGDVLCAIRDNGGGFDVEEVVARRARHGLGILGMRERVASLGGTLDIQSRSGQGTELRLRVSVEGQDAATNLAR
jgi:signal transduction histidine kinase